MRRWIENLWRGGIPAVVVHTAILYSQISLLRFECLSPGCPGILAADAPFSLIYFGIPDWAVIVWSALFGSAYWLAGGALALSLLQKAAELARGQRSQRRR